MKLFHWQYVNCLRNYGGGHILVAAEDVEQARVAASEQITGFMKEARDWWWAADGSVNEDDRDSHDNFFRLFHEDIAKPPLESTTVFIWGSD